MRLTQVSCNTGNRITSKQKNYYFALQTIDAVEPEYLYCIKPLSVVGNLEMTHPEEVSFEIFDGGDLIRLEPLHIINYSFDLDYDKNWIKTKVTVKGGVFSGQYVADFLTTDYELLKRDLRKLYIDFKGQAKFEPLEGQLVLEIKGDGLGHFEVHCTACDQPGFGGKLAFDLSFDQTELNRLIRELDTITKMFPITGDMNIKNE